MENTKIIIRRDMGQHGRPYLIEDSLELPWDASIDDWKEVFRAILFRATFSEQQINELFNDGEPD